jgi:hypothetical protein
MSGFQVTSKHNHDDSANNVWISRWSLPSLDHGIRCVHAWKQVEVENCPS